MKRAATDTLDSSSALENHVRRFAAVKFPLID